MPDREPATGGNRGASVWLGADPDEVTLADGSTRARGLYALSVDGHKLGGHPNFTQRDPRGEDEDDLVLLQIDTGRELGVLWGDAGTANFFIRRGDLAARNFFRAAYHWNCL